MKTIFDGNDLVTNLQFLDTIGGTKISWKIDGEISFWSKITKLFSGGPKKYLSSLLVRSLNNLKVVMTKEMNNFTILESTLVTIPARYYVRRDVVCKPIEAQAEINANLQKIAFFFKQNNVKMNGKPFVIRNYETLDTLKLSVYGPLKEQIFLSNPSDMSTGLMAEFTALKTILRGNYTHLTNAKVVAKAAFNNKQLRPSATILPMEVYFLTIADTNKSSQWVTAIQLPLYSKPAVAKKVYPRKVAAAEATAADPEKPKEQKEPVKDEF